jgi:Domain of unknown function (DUF4268)
MGQLGRIERVDLREHWTDEARDFTPWLALPENLSLLADALGIDLELEAQEKEVGSFHADLLCRNTADNNSWVVIENQLEKTSHKHLGQLLTYSAGLKASTIVWICSEFCEEHKAALDWLNQMAGKSMRFFGLEVELWKIGNSLAAPRFNVVCQPNDWESTIQNAAADLSDDVDRPSHKLRIRYWTAFREYLRECKSTLRAQKPGRDHWYSFGIGTSKAHTSALLIAKDRKIAVELTISSEDAKTIFSELSQQKQQIESIIGEPLEWREMPDKKASRIMVFKAVDPFDESDWPSQFVWLRGNLEKFDRAFRPLFIKMKKDESEQQPEQEPN